MKEEKEILAFKDNQVTQVKGRIIKRDPCTEIEAKLITFVSSKVQDGDTHETPYTIKVDDFFNMMKETKQNISGSYYNIIKESLIRLRKIGLEIETTIFDEDIEKNVTEGFAFFRKYRYFHKEGKVQLYLHDEVIKLYSNYQSEFTKINVMNMMQLKGKYSVPLYEYLLSWHGAKSFTCTTEKLRKALAVPTNKYKLVYNFFNRCVYPSLEEINDKTELKVEMIPVEVYRQQIKKLEFRISTKTNKPREINEIEQLLLDNGIVPATAKNLALNNSSNRIKGNYDYLKNKIATGKIAKSENIAGLLITAIKEDWANTESNLFDSQLEKELAEEKESKMQKQEELQKEQERKLLEQLNRENEEHLLSQEFAKKLKK